MEGCPDCRKRDKAMLVLAAGMFAIAIIMVDYIDKAASIQERERIESMCLNNTIRANEMLSKCHKCLYQELYVTGVQPLNLSFDGGG